MTDDLPLLGRDDEIRWRLGALAPALPGLTTLVLIVLMTAPVFASVPALPQLGLLGVFVWSSFTPGLMPPWLAFLLGLAADTLLATPFGVHATLFALAALGVRIYAGRFGLHRYRFDLMVFAAFAFGYALLAWRFLAFAGQPGPFAPLLIQVGTTTLAYPLVVAWAVRLQRRFSWG